jgi:hypothetical protein
MYKDGNVAHACVSLMEDLLISDLPYFLEAK